MSIIRVFGILFIANLVLSSTSSAQTQMVKTEEYTVSTIYEEPSGLIFEIHNGVRHFMYASGTYGENMTQGPQSVLRYGTIDEETGTITHLENVTSELVYPDNHKMVIDSQGVIHTTYIAQNLTLFYAFRTTDGAWTHRQLTTPSLWSALFPDIALGTDGRPSIGYAAIFNEGADDYFNRSQAARNETSLVGVWAVFYTSLNQSIGDWYHLDVSANHGEVVEESDFFISRNPGLIISDGMVCFAYSVQSDLNYQNYVRYVWFPEDVSEYVDNAAKFKETTHHFAQMITSLEIAYTRPVLIPYGLSLIILTGMQGWGGITITSIPFRFATPLPTMEEQRHQLQKGPLDWDTYGSEVRSISVEVVPGGVNYGIIKVLYSYWYQVGGEWWHNLHLATFEGLESGISEVDIQRLTNAEDSYYMFSNLEVVNGNELEILFMQYNRTTEAESVDLMFAQFAPEEETDTVFETTRSTTTTSTNPLPITVTSALILLTLTHLYINFRHFAQKRHEKRPN